MSTKQRNDFEYEDDSNDYEYYEERKKIKQTQSTHKQKREIRNWKKVWSQHTDDFDEYDEFYTK